LARIQAEKYTWPSVGGRLLRAIAPPDLDLAVVPAFL
jgi:hypothetical protein